MFSYIECQGKIPFRMAGFAKKDRQVLVSVTEAMHERLDVEAKKEGRRMGEMARILIAEALAARDAPKQSVEERLAAVEDALTRLTALEKRRD